MAETTNDTALDVDAIWAHLRELHALLQTPQEVPLTEVEGALLVYLYSDMRALLRKVKRLQEKVEAAERVLSMTRAEKMTGTLSERIRELLDLIHADNYRKDAFIVKAKTWLEKAPSYER